MRQTKRHVITSNLSLMHTQLLCANQHCKHCWTSLLISRDLIFWQPEQHFLILVVASSSRIDGKPAYAKCWPMLLRQWGCKPFPFQESAIKLVAKLQQVAKFTTGLLQQYIVERNIDFYFPCTKELAVKFLQPCWCPVVSKGRMLTWWLKRKTDRKKSLLLLQVLYKTLSSCVTFFPCFFLNASNSCFYRKLFRIK